MASVTEFTTVLWLCKYGKNYFFSNFSDALKGAWAIDSSIHFFHIFHVPTKAPVEAETSTIINKMLFFY